VWHLHRYKLRLSLSKYIVISLAAMSLRLLASGLALASVVDAARVKKGTGRKGTRAGKARTLATCGQKGASMNIVNGENATECEWNWQVGLMSSAGGKPWCGGMLIAEDWALTAAHCVSSANFFVSAGDYDYSDSSANKQFRRANLVMKHPGYNSRTMVNDIALVRVESAFELNSCVGTICLPEEDVTSGQSCWITGWGTLSSGGGQPKTMQEAKVEIISNDDCMDNYDYAAGEILPSMICAQGSAKGSPTDACQGDSGGPLVCETDGTWYINGATSWGYGCASEVHPGVWARVHMFRDWIEESMANPVEPAKCPDFTVYSEPDRDGDCLCPGGTQCIRDGIPSNCPSSGGVGAYSGYFLGTCEDCTCEDK